MPESVGKARSEMEQSHSVASGPMAGATNLVHNGSHGADAR